MPSCSPRAGCRDESCVPGAQYEVGAVREPKHRVQSAMQTLRAPACTLPLMRLFAPHQAFIYDPLLTLEAAGHTTMVTTFVSSCDWLCLCSKVYL